MDNSISPDLVGAALGGLESPSPSPSSLGDGVGSSSSNGTPENKAEKHVISSNNPGDLFSPSSPAQSYSRRLVDKKRAALAQQQKSPESPHPSVHDTLMLDRVQPQGKLGSGSSHRIQRPEQKAARRNKERERKSLVKQALSRLNLMLPEHSKNKTTLEIVKEACDLIEHLQTDSNRRSYEDLGLLETTRRYERLLTLAGIPLDTDPDVLEAQLQGVAMPAPPPPQISPMVAQNVGSSGKKSSSAAPAPYLVVSPNGSCTLSTDQPKSSSSVSDPLQTLASVAVSEDPKEHDQSSEMLLMMAAPDDKNQNNSSGASQPLVTLGPNPGQIVLAGGSLPPSSLPQVLLLPDGRLVPVMSQSDASVDSQTAVPPQQPQQIAPRPVHQLQASPKKGDTSAAKLSVVQPGQRAILPKIAAKPPGVGSGAGANRPIAPRRPIAPAPAPQPAQTVMQSQGPSGPGGPNNFPVIFISQPQPGAPGVQMPTSFGNNIVALPISSLPPGFVPQQQNSAAAPATNQNTLALPITIETSAQSDQQQQPMFTLSISPSKQSQNTPPSVNTLPPQLVAAESETPPEQTQHHEPENFLSEIHQPDVNSFLGPDNGLPIKSQNSPQKHQEATVNTPVSKTGTEKTVKKPKIAAKGVEKTPKVGGGGVVKKPPVASKTNTDLSGAKKLPSGEIEIFLPSLNPAKQPVSVTPALETDKKKKEPAAVKKTNKSPLAKKLTVVDSRPSDSEDLMALPESAISLLIGEQKDEPQKPVVVGKKNASGIIELPLDLSVPLMALKPAPKSKSGAKKNTQTDAISAQAEKDLISGYGPLLKIQTKGAQKAASLIIGGGLEMPPATTTAKKSRNGATLKVSAKGGQKTAAPAVANTQKSNLLDEPLVNDDLMASFATKIAAPVEAPVVSAKTTSNSKRRRKSKEPVEEATTTETKSAKKPARPKNSGKSAKEPAKTARSGSKRRLASTSEADPDLDTSSLAEKRQVTTPHSLENHRQEQTGSRLNLRSIEEVQHFSSDSEDSNSRPLSALMAEKERQRRLAEAEVLKQGEPVDPFDRLVQLASKSKDDDRASPHQNLPESRQQISRSNSSLSHSSTVEPIREIEAIADKDYEQAPKAPAPAISFSDVDLLATAATPMMPSVLMQHHHDDNEDEDHAPPPLDDDYEPPHAPRPVDEPDVHDAAMNEINVTAASQSDLDLEMGDNAKVNQQVVSEQTNAGLMEDQIQKPLSIEQQPMSSSHLLQPPSASSLTAYQQQEPSPSAASLVSGASVPLHHIPVDIHERSPSVVGAGPPSNQSTSATQPQQQQTSVVPPQAQQTQHRRSSHTSSVGSQQPQASSGQLNPFLLSQQTQPTQNWYEPPQERPQSSAQMQQQFGAQDSVAPSQCAFANQQQQQQQQQPAPLVQQNVQPQQQPTSQHSSHRSSRHHQQQQQQQQQQNQPSSNFMMEAMMGASLASAMGTAPIGSSKRSKLDIQTVQAVVDSQVNQLQARASALLGSFLDPHPGAFSTFSNMLLGQSGAPQNLSNNLPSHLGAPSQQLMDNAMLNLLQSASVAGGPTGMATASANPFHPTAAANMHAGAHNVPSMGHPHANAFGGVLPQQQRQQQAAAASFLNNIFPGTAGSAFPVPNPRVAPGHHAQFYQGSGGAPDLSQLGNLAQFSRGAGGGGLPPGSTGGYAEMQQACRLGNAPGGVNWGQQPLVPGMGAHQMGLPPTQQQINQQLARGGQAPQQHPGHANPFNPFGAPFG